MKCAPNRLAVSHAYHDPGKRTAQQSESRNVKFNAKTRTLFWCSRLDESGQNFTDYCFNEITSEDFFYFT